MKLYQCGTPYPDPCVVTEEEDGRRYLVRQLFAPGYPPAAYGLRQPYAGSVRPAEIEICLRGIAYGLGVPRAIHDCEVPHG